MKLQKGFTLIELMAVVAIIAILATVSMPVFNHYIEKSKAASGLAALGSFKNDVAVCFMHTDDFTSCNSGEQGVKEMTSDINWIENAGVFEGSVMAELTAQNHFQEIENVSIQLKPSAHPADAAMDWEVRCSDYDPQGGTHLIPTCVGDVEMPSTPPQGPVEREESVNPRSSRS